MKKAGSTRKILALIKALEGIGIPFMDGGYDYIREILDEEENREDADPGIDELKSVLEDLETRASGR